MTESDLKRHLVNSMRAQGGVGERIEDRFKVGWPDCIFIPPGRPVVFAEVKLIATVKAPQLRCTALQARKLLDLTRPPHAFGLLLGYHARSARLYAGWDGESLDRCASIPKPSRLDSPDWQISALLGATLAG
jgi:hypothetical protein